MTIALQPWRNFQIGGHVGPHPLPFPWRKLQLCADLRSPEISNEDRVSRKSKTEDARQFAKPTHCVIMVGCNPDQPGLREEINVP